MKISSAGRQPNQIETILKRFDTKIQEISALKQQLCLSINSSVREGDCLSARTLCAEIRRYVDQLLRMEIEAELQKCKSQNTQTVMEIIRYYDKEVRNSNKCKTFYEHQVADLQEEIKRQYKVIALMRQEVEDLMELVNYGLHANQIDGSSPERKVAIQQSDHPRSSDREGSHDLRLNLMNSSLDVIEEETERTAMSSERSGSQTNNRESAHKTDGSDANVTRERDLATHPQNYYMKIQPKSSSPLNAELGSPKNYRSSSSKNQAEESSGHAVLSKQQRESETDETFRREKVDENSSRDAGELAWPGGHFNSVSRNHLQSIFFFQDEDSESNRDQTSLKHSIQSNMQAGHGPGELSEQAYEQQEALHDHQNQEVYHSVRTGLDAPIQSEQEIHSSQGNIVHYSNCEERPRKIIQIDSKFLKSKSCKFTSKAQSNHLQQDASNEHTQEDAVSEQNTVSDYRTESQGSDHSSKPKTKQFLEEFRKTFNKCLHSMQAAKKHSTKNNIRHSQKSSGINNGQMTFGKSQTTGMISPADNAGGGKCLYRNRHENHEANRSDKENLKAIDLMLKELENNNKFVIGVKKLELKYEGEKKDGLRNGKGILYYSNGLAYEGEFVEGLRHGYGILKFNHIQIYNGDWVADEIEGQGKIRNCAIINKRKSIYSGQSPLGKWISYSGEFRSSKFQGSGTLYLQGGEKFIGNFTGGSAYGAGIIYKKNGEVESGNWKNNILVQKQ